MKDGKSEICSCRDTLAGPMEIRRVLLQITRDNEITTYAEFRKILGRVLFSMRASSHSVAEKIHKACGSDSSELFFKTREEAESRLKTLKSNRRKEMRKNFKKWRRSKRKEARKLRAQKKKQNKKKEVLKKRREEKSREAYKKWCEMRNKGMYFSNVKKQPCEIPYDHDDDDDDDDGDDHNNVVVVVQKKKGKKREAWVNTADDDDDETAVMISNNSTTKMNKENSILLDYYYGDDGDGD